LVHYTNLFFSWVDPVFEGFKHSVFTCLNYTIFPEGGKPPFIP
jgi:hypothetical protein